MRSGADMERAQLSTGKAVGFRRLDIPFKEVAACPLCGQAGAERSRLRRANYHFAQFEIPLPPQGVSLLECRNCSMLFKSAVPTPEAWNEVMLDGATDVWRPKTGEYPALPMMRPHIEGATSFLDIGASNGDLLAQLGDTAERVSALDVVEYPRCKDIVDGRGEYIIGQLDAGVEWSGEPYEIVTAFDVFEHFFEPGHAVANILSFVKLNGSLIVETGDWKSVSDQGSWYYSNILEHQIFWTRETFEYIADLYPFSLSAYALVNHKGRRSMGLPKRVALSTIVRLSPLSWFRRAMLAAGRDPGHFGAPRLVDHAFVVLERVQAG